MGARWAWIFDMGVTTSRFALTVMKGPLARLHRALSQFMLDVQTQEHGYTECYVPLRRECRLAMGTGQLPKFEGDLFAAKSGQDGERPCLTTQRSTSSPPARCR